MVEGLADLYYLPLPNGRPMVAPTVGYYNSPQAKTTKHSAKPKKTAPQGKTTAPQVQNHRASGATTKKQKGKINNYGI